MSLHWRICGANENPSNKFCANLREIRSNFFWRDVLIIELLSRVYYSVWLRLLFEPFDFLVKSNGTFSFQFFFFLEVCIFPPCMDMRILRFKLLYTKQLVAFTSENSWALMIKFSEWNRLQQVQPHSLHHAHNFHFKMSQGKEKSPWEKGHCGDREWMRAAMKSSLTHVIKLNLRRAKCFDFSWMIYDVFHVRAATTLDVTRLPDLTEKNKNLMDFLLLLWDCFVLLQ